MQTRKIYVDGSGRPIGAPGASRAFEERVKRVEETMDRLDAQARRNDVKPLIDRAVAAGVIEEGQREDMFRAYEAAPEVTRRVLTQTVPSRPKGSLDLIEPEERRLLEERFQKTFAAMFPGESK